MEQQKRRSEIRSHGIRLLLPNHKDVKKIRRRHSPSNHGHKVWPTSWLLIDYLKTAGIGKGKRVLDMACGWGLSGIFCAKAFNAEVTWNDADEEVCPYLKLLAEKNKVAVNFMRMDIDRIGRSILRNIDVVVASDICFCDSLIDPLRRFVNRAKNAGVFRIYISDPGRWPFDDLAELFINKKGAELLEWNVTKPVTAQGKILKLDF